MNRDNFGKALCLGGIAVAIAGLVASYLSWFWIEFDVLSHFTLHFCLVIAALGLALFVSRPMRIPVVLVVMVAGIIGIGSWSKLSADHLPADFDSPEGSKVLKIVHFNTWGRNGQIEAVAAEIGRLDPDLVFLTEMGRDRQGLQELLEARFAYWLPEKPSTRNQPADVFQISIFPINHPAQAGRSTLYPGHPGRRMAPVEHSRHPPHPSHSDRRSGTGNPRDFRTGRTTGR